jgi:hypothetical protein
VIYLSGTYSQILPQYRHEFGYMINVNRATGQEREAVRHPWMLDNGAFSNKWSEDVWRKRLEQLAQHNATCIGAVVPDVVGNHVATLERWHLYADIVKALGYKAAFATQDGATVGTLPWAEIDVLFVGGTDKHSTSSIMRFCEVDSVDGTYFKFESGHKRTENILWAVKRCNARKLYQPELLSTADLSPRPMLLAPSR